MKKKGLLFAENYLKRTVAVCLLLIMIFSVVSPVSALENGDTPLQYEEMLQNAYDQVMSYSKGSNFPSRSKAGELTEEDYEDADAIFAKIQKLESAPEKKGLSQTQKTDAAEAIVRASDSYVEGSLERNGDCFTWWTDDGIRCIYQPMMQEKYENMTPSQEPQPDRIENEPIATRATTKKQVYLIGPYYGYDDSFTNQYKNEAKEIAKAVGDTDGYTLYSGKSATVDKVATAVENGAIVIFDSHGATDYAGDLMGVKPNGDQYWDYVSSATYSYICLTTRSGLTTTDYADGAAYGTDGNGMTCAFINGETILNHMDTNSPSGFIWMATCYGMATDTLWEPLRSVGAEVVYGYSQSVSFTMDYLYEETFWDHMIAGESVATAIAAAKEKWGCWDNSSKICSVTGYGPIYSSIDNARRYRAAFPFVVSDEDFYAGQRKSNSFYGACSLQNVKSSYTLEKPYGVPDYSDPAENYKQLCYYINRYGQIDENGNSYITEYLETEEIIYYVVMTNTGNGIQCDYMMVTDGTEYLVGITSFLLKANSEIVDVEMVLGLYDQETLVDSMSATQPVNFRSFTTASLYKIYESGAYIDSDLATNCFNLSMQMFGLLWDGKIYQTLGFGIYGLCFSMYDGCGNPNPDPNAFIPQGLTYKTVNGEIVITGYTGSAESIILPDAINGLYVTAIAEQAFYENTDLTSVTLGCNITTIGDGAFACSGLKEFRVLRRVNHIGYLALNGCENMTKITVDAGNTAYYPGTSADMILYNADRTVLIQAPSAFITVFSIPNYVTTIAPYAFSGSDMVMINLETGNFTTIGEGAFAWSENLSSVSIGPYTKNIDDYAFAYCTKIRIISIPASVENIGEGVFMGCTSLKQIKVDVNNPYYCNDDYYVLHNKDKTVLMQAPATLSVDYTIADTVTSVAPYAFYGCSELNKLTFTADAPEFGENAFVGVTADIYYPAGNKTWTAAVRQNYGGKITWIPYGEESDQNLDENLSFYQIGLSFAENIGVQPLLMTSAVKNYDSYYVEAVQTTADGTVTTVLSPSQSASSYTVYDLQMLPRAMTDRITLTVYAQKDGVLYHGNPVETSITALAVEKIAAYQSGNDPAACRVLVDMLTYGAEVQKAFGYKTQDVPTNYLGQYASLGTTAQPAISGKVLSSTGNVKVYANSLSLGSMVEVQFMFKTADTQNCALLYDINGKTVTISAEQFDTTALSGYSVASFAVKPRNFRDTITMALIDSTTGKPVSAVYLGSIEDYAAGNLEKYPNLIPAMMNYGDAVLARFPE